MVSHKSCTISLSQIQSHHPPTLSPAFFFFLRVKCPSLMLSCGVCVICSHILHAYYLPARKAYLFSPLGKYYNAHIDKLSEDGLNCTVSFPEYGNTEIVTVTRRERMCTGESKIISNDKFGNSGKHRSANAYANSAFPFLFRIHGYTDCLTPLARCKPGGCDETCCSTQTRTRKQRYRCSGC